MDLVWGSLVLGLSVVPLVLIAVLTTRQRHGYSVFLFLFLLMLDHLLLGFPLLYDVMAIPGLEWNWAGKLCSIALSLTIVVGSNLSFDDVGLTSQHRVGSVLPATIVTIFIIIVGGFTGYEFLTSNIAATERVAYELTISGIAAELAYRGVLLALLHRALPARRHTFTFWWPAIIITFAFGFLHGLGVENGQVTFDYLSFMLPFLSGAVFVWLREYTGSLLFPIIAHSATNTAFLFAGTF